MNPVTITESVPGQWVGAEEGGADVGPFATAAEVWDSFTDPDPSALTVATLLSGGALPDSFPPSFEGLPPVPAGVGLPEISLENLRKLLCGTWGGIKVTATASIVASSTTTTEVPSLGPSDPVPIATCCPRTETGSGTGDSALSRRFTRSGKTCCMTRDCRTAKPMPDTAGAAFAAGLSVSLTGAGTVDEELFHFSIVTTVAGSHDGCGNSEEDADVQYVDGLDFSIRLFRDGRKICLAVLGRAGSYDNLLGTGDELAAVWFYSPVTGTTPEQFYGFDATPPTITPRLPTVPGGGGTYGSATGGTTGISPAATGTILGTALESKGWSYTDTTDGTWGPDDFGGCIAKLTTHGAQSWTPSVTVAEL